MELVLMCESITDLSGPHVFAIEDNPADVRLVEEGVAAADTELNLHVVSSGKQAAEQLREIDAECTESHPDLLLIDLNLPGKSGFDLLRIVRNESVFQHVPVVVVSSSEDQENINHSYELSANAYVTKPADPDNYIRMISDTIDFWISTTTTPQSNE